MVSLRSYGDVVTIYLGSLPVYVLTDSALAYQVLAVEADHFGKGVFFEKFRPYFGNGLVLSSGEFYRRQRRLVQPSFHRERIARYAETMIDLASVMAESWRPGQIVAFDDRMQDLALAIVGRTLFATKLGRQAVEEVRRSIPIMLNDGLVRVFSPKVVERLPIPGTGASTMPSFGCDTLSTTWSNRQGRTAATAATCCPCCCSPGMRTPASA